MYVFYEYTHSAKVLIVAIIIFVRSQFIRLELILSYPFWFILFCLLAGGVYAYVLYAKSTQFNETASWVKKALAIFRFVTVSILVFFLLSPFIKSAFREIEKPVVVLAVDNSQSIRNDSARVSTSEIVNKINDIKSALSSGFEVKTMAFGEGVKNNAEFTFTDKLTNISNVFDEIKTLYNGRNLGSVILVSDGIYNTGSNPLYKANDLKVPVFTVALGDTTVNKDVILSGINHNKVAYLGNNFPFEIKVDARQASGENSLLSVKEDSSVIFSRNISISGSNYHLNIPVYAEAKSKGIHRYRVSLSSVKDEKNVQNNIAEIYVEVLESKQKVLILANAPHPDVAALRTILEKSNNYDVKLANANSFTDNVSEFNLVIFHQLPSSSASNIIMEKIQKASVPVFYIVGSQTNLNAFNSLQTGVSVSQPLNKLNEVLPSANESFSLFTLSEDVFKTVIAFPPLYAPFGSYKTTGEVFTLLTQKIGSVETGQPMLYFKDVNGLRNGVLFGEGFWKWRLREYADKNVTTVTDELFSKIIQYLIVKDKRTPFRIQYKTNVTENEPLLFDAELYNNAGELVNEPEINMVVTNADKKEYRYTFSRINKTYHLNAGNFTPGRYTFKADTKLGDKVYNDRGEFSVSSLMVENTETTANHQLLYSMAKNSGAQMVSINETSKIIDAVKNNSSIKPVSYYHKKLTELISLKWVLALLITLLSLEWFLRKRSGAY